MNTSRAIAQRRGGAASGGKQDPPQAPVKGLVMPVNLAELTDNEVRASLSQMAQSITMKAQAMTA